MKSFAAMLFLFALTAFVLPGVTAQDKDVDTKDVKDEKKKDAKDEKKDAKDEKKDAKDEKKEEMAKKPTFKKGKNIDPEEEKILKETFRPMRARILRMEGNSSGEFTVQLTSAYPPKIAQIQQWYADQVKQKSVTAETFNQYRMKMSQANEVDIRTGSGMKVRTMFPPQEFDDKGNLKRWTAKELAAAKGASRLPGFPAQIDVLRPGQIVDLYLPKLPTGKTAAKKKKKDLDDDFEDPLLKPEVLMVVVLFEPPQRP